MLSVNGEIHIKPKHDIKDSVVLRHSPQVEKVFQEEKGCVSEHFGFVTATQFEKIFILLIKLMPFAFLFRILPNPFSKG